MGDKGKREEPQAEGREGNRVGQKSAGKGCRQILRSETYNVIGHGSSASALTPVNAANP